jgi:hypothetical protein
MKRTRFTDEQIIGILAEHEAGPKCADLCRKHGMSEGAFYNWKAKFGGMTVPEAKRLNALADVCGPRQLRPAGSDRVRGNRQLPSPAGAPSRPGRVGPEAFLLRWSGPHAGGPAQQLGQERPEGRPGVILHMLEIGVVQFFHDPMVVGTVDIQELSKTHEIVSRSKTELWHRILTHYLPLYFPEADRFHRRSRTDWFLAFLWSGPFVLLEAVRPA